MTKINFSKIIFKPEVYTTYPKLPQYHKKGPIHVLEEINFENDFEVFGSNEVHSNQFPNIEDILNVYKN